ncbi:MAG: COX15/CtaA family protein [Planctomycetes bacterium]|nr:COX15/CtaA family protein [Planctomycetota bacterium]
MNPPRNLHRLAILVAAVAFLMISVGATVTSRDAGLSIPDPVTNHGGIVPIQQLQNGYETAAGRNYSGGDVFSEFFHRAVGWTLGILSIALAYFTYKYEPRASVRNLAYLTVGVVAMQGAVGGLGVWMQQPAAMVVPHALLAQTYLAIVVAIVYLTSGEGLVNSTIPPAVAPSGMAVVRGARALVAIAFIQIVLGAVYRHANAAWAIWLHVAGALLFAAVAAWVATAAQSAGARLGKHAMLLGAIVMLQIFLGFLALLFRKPKNDAAGRDLYNILFPTLHVMAGALLTAGSTLLMARAGRLLEFNETARRAAAAGATA